MAKESRLNLSETSGGWKKYERNPVLVGPKIGKYCADITVLQEGSGRNIKYRMYFTWGFGKGIGMVESWDGVNWSEPVLVLGPRPETGWEEGITRMGIMKKDGRYLMWYTGGYGGIITLDVYGKQSLIGFAQSEDGIHFTRLYEPVLKFEKPWEREAVMCPNVMWEEEKKRFSMWYSAGNEWEPDGIGYASSPDGIHWTKHEANPIFKPDPGNAWEQDRVGACDVFKLDGLYVMFYIGYEELSIARIGAARSKDGITHWVRHPANPLISRSKKGEWDDGSCYKPSVLWEAENDRWLLWYNASQGHTERIGLAMHPGKDLGF